MGVSISPRFPDNENDSSRIRVQLNKESILNQQFFFSSMDSSVGDDIYSWSHNKEIQLWTIMRCVDTI